MTKQAFKDLFFKIASEAIEQARLVSGKEIPSKFIVEMHGAGISGRIMPDDDAVNAMYIDGSLFYRCIDVGVKCVDAGTTVLFVGVSGHAPGTFDQTWNTPKGNGPFKVVVPLV